MINAAISSRVPRVVQSLFLILFATALSTSVRADQTWNFNPDWKLFVGDPAEASAPEFDDSAWTRCTLPRAWNEDSAFAVSIDKLPTGIAWYRKTFTQPEGSTGKKVFVEFEGIRFGGEFFLNGKSIGRSDNGVTAFGFDITDALLPAPQNNVLAARIDNAWNYREAGTNSTFQWNDRNFYANYGGINKNVYLHVKDKLHQTLPLFSSLGTTGVYIYANQIDIPARSATINTESEVKNDHAEPKAVSYHVTIADMEGKIISTFDGDTATIAPGAKATLKASAKVSGLNFWSWGYGYLYTVRTTLKVDGKEVDSLATRTGFRKTAFNSGYISLNDRPIIVHGYAQRTSNEWPALGSGVPAWMSDFSNGLMVHSGGNLVRWMHVAPWKQDVESCDRVGLMQAMPAGDSERDATGRRWEQRVEVMRDAIIYNRNNPSIILYECGNKGISEPHMIEMKAMRDKYDPHGGRAIGSREMLMKDTVAEWGGEMLYINKSAGKPLWATEYSRDEGARKYWDEFTPPYHSIPRSNEFRRPGPGEDHFSVPPAYVYNRNQDTHAIENVTRWYDYWRERPGTGTRVSGGGVNIIFSDSNTHYRGIVNYRCSGEVDAMRLPKDGFYAHMVMWDGWVDVENPRMHIVGHWNYDAGTTKDIYVISSADKVELLLNGKSIGYGKQSNRFLFTFSNVAWESGTLRAVATNTAGKVLCVDERKTAGAPAAIKLSPRTGAQGLLADGADIGMVEFEVVDAIGLRCPTALNSIHFDVTGPAEWRGGIAYDEKRTKGNYILARDLPVECGINRAMIRSTTEAGTIRVTATAEGLAPASLEFASKPVSVPNGLSAQLPSANLPAFLVRGPTPATPSFTITRKAIPFASVTAGSNESDASQSFDDNESTGWSNDGKLETAWIEYDLGGEKSPTEVTLKQSGWRTRSYPLQITLDGKDVYRGQTGRSLGYVTLQLKPASGRKLRIGLTGATGPDRDGFNLIEITGQKEIDAPTTQGAFGTLNIIEAEVYEGPGMP